MILDRDGHWVTSGTGPGSGIPVPIPEFKPNPRLPVEDYISPPVPGLGDPRENSGNFYLNKKVMLDFFFPT